jgi:hypothetical protein
MKNTIQKLLLLSLFMTLFSCVKNDEPTPPTIVYVEENPVKNYIAAAGFTVLSSQVSVTTFEKGFSFIPKVTGNYDSLVVKFPINTELSRYTLWDNATGLEIQSRYIDPNATDVEKIENINTFKLIKGKEYSFSCTTKNYTKYTRPDNADAVFPIETANFTITSSCSSLAAGSFPGLKYKNAYFGSCGFLFKQTQ